MTVSVEDNRTIKIILSAKELEANGMSLSLLYCSCVRSKLFLQKMFLFCKTATNFQRNGDVLSVEIFPASLGGCTIYFTPIGQIKQEKTKAKLNIPQICSLSALFSGIDELMDFAFAVKKLGIIIKMSSLYERCGKYLLMLTPFSIDLAAVKLLLSEFAESVKVESNKTEKDGYRTVCKFDALTNLTKFM